MAYSNLIQTANLLQVPNLLEVLGSSGFSNGLQVANTLIPGSTSITNGFELENGAGQILLENGSYLLQG